MKGLFEDAYCVDKKHLKNMTSANDVIKQFSQKYVVQEVYSYYGDRYVKYLLKNGVYSLFNVYYKERQLIIEDAEILSAVLKKVKEGETSITPNKLVIGGVSLPTKNKTKEFDSMVARLNELINSGGGRKITAKEIEESNDDNYKMVVVKSGEHDVVVPLSNIIIPKNSIENSIFVRCVNTEQSVWLVDILSKVKKGDSVFNMLITFNVVS